MKQATIVIFAIIIVLVVIMETADAGKGIFFDSKSP
jgi:hypothetical protein